MDKLIISDDDKHLLTDYKVRFDNSNGYYRVYSKGGKYVYLHRLVSGAKKGDIVDHIDRDKHNNQRGNLRIVSKSLNNYNRDVVNSLGRGIYFDKAGNRYRACISVEHKTLKLGSFKNINEAKKAYNEASLKIHGDNGYQHIFVDLPHIELT